MRKDPIGLSSLIRILGKYDPLYTPRNLKKLKSLVDSGFAARPWFKKDILGSAISYTKAHNQDITPLAYELASRGPGEIPQPILLRLIELQRYYHNDGLVQSVWNYLTYGGKSEPLSLPIPLLLAFMRFFGPRPQFRQLALRISDDLLSSDHIHAPLVALAVTRTKISCRDYSGATSIASKVKLIDRPLAGALLVAYAALGDETNADIIKKNISELEAIELSGLVKNIAQNSLADAVDFLAASEADDNTKQLAFNQLLNQAIYDKNEVIFKEYLDKLAQTVRHSEGMLMNLKIKWHAHHGTFDQAKLEYQLKVHKVHVMHQITGFKQLKKFARKLAPLESSPISIWLKNEEQKYNITWDDLNSLQELPKGVV